MVRRRAAYYNLQSDNIISCVVGQLLARQALGKSLCLTQNALLQKGMEQDGIWNRTSKEARKMLAR